MARALACAPPPPLRVIAVQDALYGPAGKAWAAPTTTPLWPAATPPCLEPARRRVGCDCVNYTSGTTGNPKGVVYHHRGAATQRHQQRAGVGHAQTRVYLWTLPMFHCNGWCFPWTMAAVAGVNVCLRRVDAPAIFDAIRPRRLPLRRAHRARAAW